MSEYSRQYGRFSSEALQDSTVEANRYPYFEKVPGTEKDKFGNRLFKSPELSYLDREQRQVEASLLISGQGEEFIKQHPRILNDTDTGMRYFEDQPHTTHVQDHIVELAPGRTLSPLGAGHQSNAYILETGTDRVVVKRKNNLLAIAEGRTEDPEFSGLDQPYINEMLQIQSLGTERGPLLAEIGIKMPEFLFASGQISCTRYEEGRHAFEVEIDKIRYPLTVIVEDYIEEQLKKRNELWENVQLDLVLATDFSPKTGNFIVRKDGKMVWIDPFFYEKVPQELKMHDKKYVNTTTPNAETFLTPKKMQQAYRAAQREIANLEDLLKKCEKPRNRDKYWTLFIDSLNKLQVPTPPGENVESLFQQGVQKALDKYKVRYILKKSA